MMSRREGKNFTIPSVEDVRNYELAEGTNGPLLFNKHKETSVRSKEATREAIRLSDSTSDQARALVTTTTTPENVETTSASMPAAGTSASMPAAGISASTYCITANPVQRQNPVVRFIRNIPVTFDDVIPDFVLGKTTCALFLRWGLTRYMLSTI